MGGTGIRCLLDLKKNKRGVDTRQTKPVNSKGKKKTFLEICEKEEEEEFDSDPSDCQQTDNTNNENSCKCLKSSPEKVPCCSPGCSLRMPCLACSKNGCRAAGATKSTRKKECTCKKNMFDNSLKTRSRSEGRNRAKSSCREIVEFCGSKTKKNGFENSKKLKTNIKRSVGSDTTLGATDCSTSSNEEIICDLIKVAEKKPKSPCRQLKNCPCDSCKNVTFNEKCEVFPASCEEISSCEEEQIVCPKKGKSKSKSCTSSKPCQQLNCTKAHCSPIKPFQDKNCSCDDCRPQISPTVEEICGINQQTTGMSMMPPTYVPGYQTSDYHTSFEKAGTRMNMSWPKEINCPYEIPNRQNSLYQNSYPTPTFSRQY